MPSIAIAPRSGCGPGDLERFEVGITGIISIPDGSAHEIAIVLAEPVASLGVDDQALRLFCLCLRIQYEGLPGKIDGLGPGRIGRTGIRAENGGDREPGGPSLNGAKEAVDVFPDRFLQRLTQRDLEVITRGVKIPGEKKRAGQREAHSCQTGMPRQDAAKQFDRFAAVCVDERELSFEEQDLRVIRINRVKAVRQSLRFARVILHDPSRGQIQGFFKADYD